MMIDFELPVDDDIHEYCPFCHFESLTKVYDQDRSFFQCGGCSRMLERRIVIDPDRLFWVEETTKELWHESVGVFILNQKNEALFFERTAWPFEWTIPAGHRRKGETAIKAAIVEVIEETGIYLEKLDLFAEEDMHGDQCVYGADNHHWHLFRAKVDETAVPIVKYEGKNPVWVSYEEVLKLPPTYAVRHFIEKYGEKLFE